MTFIELFLIAIGLSMDAFAVSICKGLCIKKITPSYIFIPAIWFGGFQAIMPLIGYFLANQLSSFIKGIDHWIAFILLVGIGINMIRESLKQDDSEDICNTNNSSFGIKTMFFLALATSIDALVVGITFAVLSINIWEAITIIGCTTFIFSIIGIVVGNSFGQHWQKKTEILGGCILIGIGIKTLVQHLIEHI